MVLSSWPGDISPIVLISLPYDFSLGVKGQVWGGGYNLSTRYSRSGYVSGKSSRLAESNVPARKTLWRFGWWHVMKEALRPRSPSDEGYRAGSRNAENSQGGLDGGASRETKQFQFRRGAAERVTQRLRFVIRKLSLRQSLESPCPTRSSSTTSLSRALLAPLNATHRTRCTSIPKTTGDTLN